MSSIATRVESPVGAAKPLHRRIIDREGTFGYVLLVPTLVLLGIFLAFPFLYGIWLSVTTAELDNPGHFVGLANYIFEFTIDSPFFRQGINSALGNTFIYTIVTTIFKLTLGLAMALLLNQAFPAQRFIRAALLLPWIIPTVLSTLAWKWMFDPTFSVINWAAVSLHLIQPPGPNWFSHTWTAWTALMIVNIWRGTPFYGISFLAGLQVIPIDLYEAARVDGASRWQQFRRITLPLLRPVLLVVLMLSTILTFADFQVPFVLTNGAPYSTTYVLSTWAYQLGVPGGSIGLGAAVSLVLFPLLAIVIAGVLLVLRSPDNG
jgi:multiple sugar transport system permease protein